MRITVSPDRDTAGEAAPTLDALEPFTEDLPEISEEMNDFADALDPALESSQPVLDRADELLREARRPAEDLRVAGPELAQTVGGAKTLVRGLTEDREQVYSFVRNWALNLNGSDAISHYWRIVITIHPDSWTYITSMLGLPELPSVLPEDAAQTQAAAASSDDKASGDLPEVVNGVTKPLTGLTGNLAGGGSLLSGKKSSDGGSTGLSEKQESGLLGFLFGGEE